MKRLKTILQYDNVEGFLIYISISILLLVLSLEYPLLFIPYVIFLIIIFKNNKSLFLYSLIADIICLISFLVIYLIFNNTESKNVLEGTITYTEDNYFILKSKLFSYKVYYNDSLSLNIGSYVSVDVKENINKSLSNINIYSYQKYLKCKLIIGEYKLININNIKETVNIYRIRGLVINYINNNFSDTTRSYIMKLLLGFSSFDSSLNDNINNLGILYLYSVSGLHINIMNDTLKRFLRLINIPEEINSIIVSIFFIFFLLISSESSSIKRSIIMILIKEITSILSFKINRLDILSIAFIIEFITNPFLIYDTGFYLTYLSTLIIVLSKNIKSVRLTARINLFTIPFILFKNSKISIFIIICSLLFNSLFSYLLIPFTYLTFIFKFLNPIYEILASTLNNVISYLDSFNIFLYFSINNVYILILMYLFIFLIYKYFKKRNFKKVLVHFICFFVILIFTTYYYIFPVVEYIDVGQGDSALITYRNKRILIDTGKEDNYHTVYNYLIKHNIYKLDYLFISHYDSDHCGELEYLTNNIKIDKLIDKKSDDIKIGYMNIKSYQYESSDENNNSLVLLVSIYNNKFLFTGDIESESEEKLMNEDIENITFLKVAHHGSNSSSSIEFLNRINPKVSIISVGINNSYNHPSDQVLSNLEEVNSLIYRTDLMGEIIVSVNPFFSFIENYKSNELKIINTLKYSRLIIP